MPNNTTANQQVPKDAQKKVTDAVAALYDAQLALQKNALDAARVAFESTLTLQRKGLQTLSQAVESAPRGPAFDAAAFEASLRSYVVSLPGMTPETADRIVKDTASALGELQATTARTVDAVRQAALQGAQQYEKVLGDVEGRAKPAFESAGQGAQRATETAKGVTEAWVGSFFEAVKNATAEAQKPSK